MRGARQLSFDEDDVSDEEPECECQRLSLDRSRGNSSETPDEPELAVSPPTPAPMSHVPLRPHLRGVSSDRVLTDRHSSPAFRGPPRAFSQGIFEKRLPKIYKSLMDKPKRASSSALYERPDRSPTEAFYNATGSTRLSSQELFEKFCSEDFTSLYGREERRRRTAHSKSTGSSGSDVRHEKTCCRRTAPCGSQPVLARRHLCRAPRSDRSTDSEEQASPHHRNNSMFHPYSTDYEPDEDDEIQEENFSRSAPLLSPDRFAIERFTFDISEHSESFHDETPSDATETRNLTLYDEPLSDQTSLCDLYDVAFSSNRPSFRRRSSKHRRERTIDLSQLDFRAIDDESPMISRRPSNRSPDETLCQNSESRSWASDSVFTTPERRPRDSSPSSNDTRRDDNVHSDYVRADSVAAGSTLQDTTFTEELTSVIERPEFALANKLDELTLDSDIKEFCASQSPVKELTKVCRASMQKLEPIELVHLNVTKEEKPKRNSSKERRSRRGVSEPRQSSKCFPL